MSLLSGMKDAPLRLSISLPELEAKKDSSLSEAMVPNTDKHSTINLSLSAREKHAVSFCRAYIEHRPANAATKADLQRIGAFLLQIATLQSCSLQERTCAESLEEDKLVGCQDQEFLHLFCSATQSLLEKSPEVDGPEGWDLCDIVDGRVFHYLLQVIRNTGKIPSEVLAHARVLYNETVQGRDLEAEHPFATLKSLEGVLSPQKAARKVVALPFSHPVLDSFLKGVEIGETEETQDTAAELVFEDLRHWHAYKPINQTRDREQISAWEAMRRQKRMQWRMAEVTDYAASLTGSTGKTFNREVIVVGAQDKQKFGAAIKTGPPKQNKQKSGKGGKQSARLEAQRLSDQKAQKKLTDILNHWRDKCIELENINSLIDRYLKTLDFQSTTSSGGHEAVRPEVQLYLCHVLTRIWSEARKQARGDSPEG
jgi:hypothetical protein